MKLSRYLELVRSSHIWLLAPTWIAVNASIGLWFSQSLFAFARRNERFPEQVLMRGYSNVQIAAALVEIEPWDGDGALVGNSAVQTRDQAQVAEPAE